MPRFLSKMQGEFSLKEVGFEVVIKCYGIEIRQKFDIFANSPVWRFKINQKIRVFAILNEITENNVIAFILWIDPNHKSG